MCKFFVLGYAGTDVMNGYLYLDYVKAWILVSKILEK